MDMMELIKVLKEDEHELYPQASEQDIEMTEATLKTSLPESYKIFLKEFSNGAYLYMCQEVSSVGEGNEQIYAIHKQKWTKEDRNAIASFYNDEQVKIEFQKLIPFSLDSNGNTWCFVIDNNYPDNEYPIAYLDMDKYLLYGKLSGFVEWLSILIREQDEIIRVLYDEDVIVDQLGLG